MRGSTSIIIGRETMMSAMKGPLRDLVADTGGGTVSIENDDERERDDRPYHPREDSDSGRRHRHRNEDGDRDRKQQPKRDDSADDQERRRKLDKHRSGRDHRRRRDSRSSSP